MVECRNCGATRTKETKEGIVCNWCGLLLHKHPKKVEYMKCKKCGSLDTYKEHRHISGRVEIFKKKKNGRISKKYTVEGEGSPANFLDEMFTIWICNDCNNNENIVNPNFEKCFDEFPNTPRDGD